MLKTYLNKRWAVLSLALLFSVLAVLPAFAATTPGLAQAGEETYISLHQIVSPTDEENVYKVTLTIDAGENKALLRNLDTRTEVVVVMEQSKTMNLNDKGAQYNSLPGNDDVGSIGPGVLGFYDSAYWLNPFRDDYIDIDKHLAATKGLHDYSDTMDFLYQLLISMGMDGSGFERPFDKTKNPDLSSNTHIYATAQGVVDMMKALADPGINAGVDTTTIGVVSMSGPMDSSFTPYYDPVVDLNNSGVMCAYGYGRLYSGVYVPGMYTLGLPIGNMGVSAVRYSTRQVTDPSGKNPWTTSGYSESFHDFHTNIISNAAYAGHSILLESNEMLTRGQTTLPYADQKYPSADVSTKSDGGLIQATEYKTIQADLQKHFRAATDQDDDAWLYDGIAEAAMIFFGKEADELLADPLAPTNGAKGGAYAAIKNDPDDIVTRYVVLVSSGRDSNVYNPDFQQVQTMNLVNGMKNSGVQFMVVSVAADGGDPESSSTLSQKYSPYLLSDMLKKNRFGAGQEGDPTATTAVMDDSAWLALIATPMGYKSSSETVVSVGDPNVTASASNALKTNCTSWADVAAVYNQAANIVQYEKIPTIFTYVPADKPELIQDVLKDYTDEMVNFDRSGKTVLEIGSDFDLYQYPNHSLFKTSTGVVQRSGKKLTWDLKDGIPQDGHASLSFYVKLNTALAAPGEYCQVLSFAEFSSTGKYKTATNTRLNPRIVTIQKDFPVCYITAGGEIKTDASEESGAADLPPEYGTVQDQVVNESRFDEALLPMQISAQQSGAAPDITAVEAKKTKDGRGQVSVSVKNGADMYFQWQYKDKNENWRDVSGANSSVYTLGRFFRAGKKYQFRCEISNRAGKKHYSDVIDLVASRSAAAGEGLQSGATH